LWYISVTSPSQRLSNVMDSMQSQRSPLRGVCDLENAVNLLLFVLARDVYSAKLLNYRATIC